MPCHCWKLLNFTLCIISKAYNVTTGNYEKQFVAISSVEILAK
jgi:hypothetical protein